MLSRIQKLHRVSADIMVIGVENSSVSNLSTTYNTHYISTTTRRMQLPVFFVLINKTWYYIINTVVIYLL